MFFIKLLRLIVNTIKVEKDILSQQVEVYLHDCYRKWGVKMYSEWLTFFVSFTEKQDIFEVTDEDEKGFLAKVNQIVSTVYEREQARKAIKGLRAYFKARTKNLKGNRGRPPHLSEIEQIKRYHKMGLKYKEIEKITGKRISWISRAVHYVRKD